jgi:hypothetical protein
MCHCRPPDMVTTQDSAEPDSAPIDDPGPGRDSAVDQLIAASNMPAS